MSSSYRMKTVLITGCSSGIGAALALEFARRGLKVIAIARTKLDLQKLRESHRNITALRLDVHEKNAILALKNEVGQITGGGLDYFVNNAGAHYASPAMDIDISKVEEIFEVNVFAVMHMCEAFSRLLIARKGVIIQIGSVIRDVPMICQSPYNATKAALSQYTRTLRLELAPFGVQVVEVVTGFVQSNILRPSRLRCDIDVVILSVSAEVQVVSCPGNKDEAKVLRKLAELVKIRMFEVHVAKASKLHLLRTIDDLWDPYVRHNTLACAVWEFAEIVEGE